MYRSKVVKKKTKNRETLLRNLNKGKARLQPRCGFEIIPHPLKYPHKTQVHYLHADVPLLEVNNTLTLEASLYNNYKTFKNAQIQQYPTQKVLRMQVENKCTPSTDWEELVKKLSNSESIHLKEWAPLITKYCERHETVVQQFLADQIEMSEERLQSLKEINAKTQKIKENIVRSFPFLEFKSQLKNGDIQLVEMGFSEKYLKELNYDIDDFASLVFQEGLPEMVPSDGPSASAIAKFRLLKYLTTDPDGYQTPEFESTVVMRGGYIKKIKIKVHYLTFFEKGVPGFTFIAVIIGKQRPVIPPPKHVTDEEVNPDFVNLMKKKEKEAKEFLELYYKGEKADETYTNLHKTCQIKELSLDPKEQHV